MKYDCLIVDDEEMLAKSTAEYFNLSDIKTHCVFSAESCLEFLKNDSARVILLDINLGESSGFELCKTLRKTEKAPIIFISARSSDDDVLIALNIGGDDYIQKPYSLGILSAKVKAVLRRIGDGGHVEKYSDSRITIDFSASRVFVGNTEVKLKALEYKLLCCLAENCGKTMKKEELFEKVWADSFTGDGTLNVHIRHLREKIEKDPNNPEIIKTVWGVGYIFEEAK